MKMLFKQRMFSWFDSYDIYDEYGNTVFVVKGQLSWGHCLRIFDAAGCPVGCVKEKIFTWMPKFELYTGEDNYVGCLSRELTLFRPSYHIDCNGWRIEGSFWEWDYDILAPSRHTVAHIAKAACQVWLFREHFSASIASTTISAQRASLRGNKHIARGHTVPFHRFFPFVSATLAYQAALSLGVRLPVA